MAIPKLPYRNADGQNIFYGVSEGQSGSTGQVKTYGDVSTLTQIINLADLTTTSQYLDVHSEIPKGAFIESVEILVLVVAASSGTGTLNVGLSGTDLSTNLSDTALVSAATASSLAAGAKLTIVVGGTAVGSAVGTKLALNELLTAKAGTAVFQSGKIEVRVNFNFVA